MAALVLICARWGVVAWALGMTLVVLSVLDLFGDEGSWILAAAGSVAAAMAALELVLYFLLRKAGLRFRFLGIGQWQVSFSNTRFMSPQQQPVLLHAVFHRWECFRGRFRRTFVDIQVSNVEIFRSAAGTLSASRSSYDALDYRSSTSSTESTMSLDAPVTHTKTKRVLAKFAKMMARFAFDGAVNIVAHLAIFFAKFVSVVVENISIRTEGSLDVRASNISFLSKPKGLLGAVCDLSVDGIDISVPNYNFRLGADAGFSVVADFTPRFRTFFRSRRLSILDDIDLRFRLPGTTARYGPFDFHLDTFESQVCLGLSKTSSLAHSQNAAVLHRKRSLRLSQTRQFRRQWLQYWTANGSLRNFTVIRSSVVVPSGSSELVFSANEISAESYAKKEDAGYLFHNIKIDGVRAGLLESLEASDKTLSALLRCVTCESDRVSRVQSLVNTPSTLALLTKQLVVSAERGDEGYAVDVQSQGMAFCIDPIEAFNALTQLIEDLGEVRRNPSVPPTETNARRSTRRTLLRRDSALTEVFFDLGPLLFCVVPRTPVGDADLRAMMITSQSTAGSGIRLDGRKLRRNVTQLSELEVTRVNAFETKTDLKFQKLTFLANGEGKLQGRVTGSRVRWNPDLQSSVDATISQLRPLIEVVRKNKQIRNRSVNATHPSTTTPIRDRLGLYFEDVKFQAVFPDGASAGFGLRSFGPFKLADERWGGSGLLHNVQETPFVYVAEFSLRNPIVTFNSKREVRELDLDMSGVRMVLEHGFHYGNRWNNFQLRLKGFLTDLKNHRLRRGLPVRPRSMIDLKIRARDVKGFYEDSPLNTFYTLHLPLLQDESRERVLRYDLFRENFANLDPKHMMSGRGGELWESFLRQNSQIYCERIKTLRAATAEFETGPGLKRFAGPPLAALTVKEISIQMYRDADMMENNGTDEYMRLFTIFDSCDPSSQPERRSDPEAWFNNGFRRFDCWLDGARLHLRDFPHPSFEIDGLRMTGRAGLAQQHTVHPFCARTTVALGCTRAVDITKGLTSTKLTCDLDLNAKRVVANWNGAYLPAFMDFTRRCSTFGGEGKEFSPRMPWFDTLRMNLHGRIGLTIEEVEGKLDATLSPYANMSNRVDVGARNVTFSIDRLGLKDAPVHLGIKELELTPQSLSPQKFPSRIKFSAVELFYCMTYRCRSGDPTCHYVHPFPSSGQAGVERVEIRRIAKLPDIPLVAKWRSPTYVHGWDTFKTFRTTSYDFVLRIYTDHGDHHSTIYSDGVSNMTRVIRRLVQMPPPCKHAQKPFSRFDRPPGTEGLGSLMSSMSIDVTALNVKLIAWNNMVPGDGLDISITTVVFSQTRARENEHDKLKKLQGRYVSVGGLSIEIFARELDIGETQEGKGFLLAAEDIAFVTDARERMQKRKTGFGRRQDSPFHAFGEINGYRRGETLDAFSYENRLVITGIKVFWSPYRYISVFEWPKAVKEKSFVVERRLLVDARRKIRREREQAGKGLAETRKVHRSGGSGGESLFHLLQEANTENGLHRKMTPDPGDLEEVVDMSEANPVFDLEVFGAQFLFASEETRGIVILSSPYCSLGLIRKVRASRVDLVGQIANELRFHFNNAQIYTLTSSSPALQDFRHGYAWLPPTAVSSDTADVRPFRLMTAVPFTLNGVHMAFAGQIDSLSARPSALLLNTSALEFDSDGAQFRAFVDVITKVLMKRHPLNQDNQRELASLKYKMQLAGVRRPSVSELQAHAVKLQILVRNFEYSIDTGQVGFVIGLLPRVDQQLTDADDIFDRILAMRNSLVAKLNAVNIYLRKEHKVDSDMYPTMFLSYSFDKVRWKLLEDDMRTALAEVRLEQLVFRHIFYVGRVQHQEFTFGDIEIRNMQAGERKILRMNRTAAESLIKSSDDSAVHFQWYAMQMERVGGISVYENLTIHIAPLEICISKHLIDSIRGFLFPAGEAEEKPRPKRQRRDSKLRLLRRDSSEPRYARTTDQEVSDMAVRGRSTVFFKYIYIGEFLLNASFKAREDNRRKIWDITNLSLSAPSYMYHSKTWTWKDFFDQVKRDVLMTVIRRGATNLARSKLNLKQKLDPAIGRELWHQYKNLFGGDDDDDDSSSQVSSGGDDVVGPGGSVLPIEAEARRRACLDILFGYSDLDIPGARAVAKRVDRRDSVGDQGDIASQGHERPNGSEFSYNSESE